MPTTTSALMEMKMRRFMKMLAVQRMMSMKMTATRMAMGRLSRMRV